MVFSQFVGLVGNPRGLAYHVHSGCKSADVITISARDVHSRFGRLWSRIRVLAEVLLSAQVARTLVLEVISIKWSLSSLRASFGTAQGLMSRNDWVI